MKILFVTPFLPSPPRFGAERRLDAFARALARKHEVSVIWFNFENAHAPEALQATHAYCREVATTKVEGGRELLRKRGLQLRSLLSSRSFEFLAARNRIDFQRALDAMLAKERYDVVQFESAQLCAFEFEKHQSPTARFVLDEHNIEYDVSRRSASRSASRPRQLYHALNWRKLAREERAAWRRFDGIAVTSRRDQQLLTRDFPEARSAVVPNGVDLESFSSPCNVSEPDCLLFFGALNYFPNQDGLLYFIERILPLIRERRPYVRLRVVGPGAPRVIAAQQGNGVEIVGTVSDIRTYLDRAAVVVVPLRIGGGTRLKILEALAMRKAVVSTRIGAEGLDVMDERHLLLADDPALFAHQVRRVLDSPDLARRLGTEGRALVDRSHGWGQIVAGLERFYEQLRAGTSRRQS